MDYVVKVMCRPEAGKNDNTSCFQTFFFSPPRYPLNTLYSCIIDECEYQFIFNIYICRASRLKEVDGKYSTVS